jgi:TolB-like protein/class 3 adenylate cyclase
MNTDTEHRLAAIVSADVADYSRLMAEDEATTIRTLTDYREEVGMLVRQHRGRLVDFTGDNFLAEFPTALDATHCAVEMQRVLAARNADLPSERRMQFRIGIHLGDVTVEGERIYGNGVNIAARLEGLAEPGGVCVSRTVREQVRGKLALGFEDLGEQTVKNIPEPVRVYRLQFGEAKPVTAHRQRSRSTRVFGKVIGTIAVVSLLAGAAMWATWPRPLGLLLDLTGLSDRSAYPSLPDKPSVVVLPFANMSGDPEQEYFSDGITEELTNDLAQNPELFVIARNSAFSYKRQAVKVEEVGRELGVRYVVEGSVRRSLDRVRVTVQLIDTTTGFHLWSEQYDRELTDIFEVQSEISREIHVALGAEIHDATITRQVHSFTRDLVAYDLYLKALSHFRRFTRADNLEARRLFERTIERDPNFAQAVGMLSATYGTEYAAQWNLEQNLLKSAEELARRALQLDETGTGYLSLAHAQLRKGSA